MKHRCGEGEVRSASPPPVISPQVEQLQTNSSTPEFRFGDSIKTTYLDSETPLKSIMVTGFNSVCIRRFDLMVQFDLLWFDFIAGYNLASSSGETHPIAIMPSSRMLHEIV